MNVLIKQRTGEGLTLREPPPIEEPDIMNDGDG